MKKYELTLTLCTPDSYDKARAEEFIKEILDSQEPASESYLTFNKIKFLRKIKEEVALAA